MAQLNGEQNFGLNKYMIESHIGSLKSGLNNVEKILDSAQTNDDLEKAKVYFDALLQTAQNNLGKVVINNGHQKTK